ncbi:response regulator transcription factor [Aeoliella sp.]|uniref:response regulator transcription factor n=1 Tax=Aeoliella sp. TaxID=2795800 RepID=UPI003CCC3CE5
MIYRLQISYQESTPLCMAIDLTNREREVVRLISLGCSTEEAAKILGVSTPTADTHRTNAMRKMGVRKVALVTRLAIKHRISSMKDTLTTAEKRKRGRKKDGWN